MILRRVTAIFFQLKFLEMIYRDHFSAPCDESKIREKRMILDSMGDVIASLDYSDDPGHGSVEALRVIIDLYERLLKQG